jgi:hypothetical protein
MPLLKQLVDLCPLPAVGLFDLTGGQSEISGERQAPVLS